MWLRWALWWVSIRKRERRKEMNVRGAMRYRMKTDSLGASAVGAAKPRLRDWVCVDEDEEDAIAINASIR